MTDPVVLPDSSVTVDRSTIERHLSIQVGGELAVGMASQSRMHGKGPGKKEGGGMPAVAAANLIGAGTE